MKILIITTDYYPDLTPNTYRWEAIATHWVNQGIEVHVLAPHRYSESGFIIRKGVQVHRKGSNTLLDWVYNAFKIKKLRNRVRTEPDQGKPAKWQILLNKLVSFTWRKIYWPDGSCLWYFTARKKAVQLIKTYQPDVIISICLPFTATLIGSYCKRKFPNLVWISDVQDPFSMLAEQPKNNHTIYRSLNYRAERKAIKTADKIVYTLDRAREAYARTFGRRKKMHVIPPLFDDQLSRSVSELPALFDTEKINLAYFGAFYFGIREPNAFLDLLSQTIEQYPSLGLKLQVHFFGGIEPEFMAVFEKYADLSPVLQFHGLVERAVVFQRMKEADFLLNIGNTTDYQLPSKCVDYYYSAKPILNIQHNLKDAFEDFFEDYPLFLSIPLYKDEVDKNRTTTLRDFLQDQKGKTADSSIVNKKLAPYRTQAIAEKYLALIKKDE